MGTGISQVCCSSGGGGASLIHQASVTLDANEVAQSPLTPADICAGSPDLLLFPTFGAIRVIGGQDFGGIDPSALIVVGNTVGAELMSRISEAVNNGVTAILTTGLGSDTTFPMGQRLIDPGSAGDPVAVPSPLGSFVGGSSRGAG